MYGLTKAGKRWRIRTSKEIEDILKGNEIVKIYKLANLIGGITLC